MEVDGDLQGGWAVLSPSSGEDEGSMGGPEWTEPGEPGLGLASHRGLSAGMGGSPCRTP